ncbi:Serine/threonine protein kinase [Nannocystis exedens]|uniref:non-specific serine/threonine protein kinase n=1 Tax=Nannocystis exedens TaxID=54 RepID=A0A1I2BXD7_9BACT|nr:serine/threonine-protein kinase [Nannocystis exedens]PCC71197.1 putative serine/threonine protein kinase [Nannocystis exedens]SFE60767.1 Serine/threonine protein kinase [Nannocystis exedens]
MSLATAPTLPGARFDDAELAELATALGRDYTIERELGRGGMGVVLLARDLRLERLVAIKVLPRERAADAAHRQRFLREARTAAKLSHPNIVPTLHADEAGAFAYFTMPYVDGETLAERVQSRGRLAPREVARLLREVAWALAYAHARGVVHRDIKPENILVERATGRVLVNDFGIAFEAQASRLTGDDHMVGTAAFMSPEQILGRELDGRSDLYSLGVVGYWLLAGQHPFEGAAAPTVLVKHATEPAPPLRTLVPEVPAGLAAAIDRCLAKEPDARWPSGEALAEALAAVEDELGGVPARTGGDRLLDEREVSVVLQRAAQLQADAARRVEERSRAATSPAPTTASALRVSEVQAAAAEAGIAPEFVAMAAAEMTPGGALAVPAVSAAAEGRWAVRLFGKDVRQLVASRVFRAPAKAVLDALAHVWQASPYNLRLLDAVGPHPLDGGAVTFRVPKFTFNADGSAIGGFPYYMYVLSIRQVRLTMQRRGRDAIECTVTAELHETIVAGRRLFYPWMGGATTVAGAAAGVAMFMTMLPILAVLGTLGVVATVYGGLYKLNHVAYAYYIKMAQEHLETMLADVDANLRTQAVFGSLPAPRPGLSREED